MHLHYVNLNHYENYVSSKSAFMKFWSRNISISMPSSISKYQKWIQDQ